MNEKSPDTATIRKLLLTAFDDQELTTFCYDYFRTVYHRFAPETPRLVKVQLLIEHCERHLELNKLLDLIQKIVPGQYTRFITRIKELSDPPQKMVIASGRAQIEITITGDLSDFSNELKFATIAALANAINLSPKQIGILEARGGSIVLQLEMPTQVAKKLIALYKINDPLMQDLGIQQVKVLSPRFDPYSLALFMLSALIALESLAYSRYDKQLSNKENHIKRQIYQLARAIYESIDLLVQFRNFLKENYVLQEEFQLRAVDVLIEENDLALIEQLHSKAFRLNRTFAKVLSNLIPYLTLDNNDQFSQLMNEVKDLLKEAVLASDYQHFLSSLKSIVSYIFEFAYQVGKTYEKDEIRFAKMFRSANIFEDWEDNEEETRGILVQLPVLNSISAGVGSIIKEIIKGYLDLSEDERKGADFGVVVLEDSMRDLGILPGDIALIRQQASVKNGDIAAIVIRAPGIEPLGVLKRYYVEEHQGRQHWFLQSSNPSAKHLVVVPSHVDMVRIRNIYAEGIKADKIIFYENAELKIAGKYVGVVRNKHMSYHPRNDTTISITSGDTQ